jgi:hypothetical protein
MNRKVIGLLTLLLFASVYLAQAQQSRTSRIGFLRVSHDASVLTGSLSFGVQR